MLLGDGLWGVAENGYGSRAELRVCGILRCHVWGEVVCVEVRLRFPLLEENELVIVVFGAMHLVLDAAALRTNERRESLEGIYLAGP